MSSCGDDSLVAISPREYSPESHPLSGHSDYGDSGVVVNGGPHTNEAPSLLRLQQTPRSAPRRPFGFPSPLTEIRRSSLPFVEVSGMANGNGITHVPPAEELELMYAYHGNAGRRSSQPSTEAGEESNASGVAQQGSLVASQEGITRPPKTVKCISPNWWNPKFSSPILERHFKKKVVEFLRRRFRIAVLFIALSSLLWIVFFSVHLAFNPPRTALESEQRVNELARESVRFTWWYVVGGLFLFVVVLLMLLLTYSDYYGRLALALSTTLTVLLMLSSIALSFALHFDSNVKGFSTMWLVSQFSITGVVTLVIFTLSQLPVVFSAALCIIYLVISNTVSITFTVILNSDIYSPIIFGPSAVGTLFFYCALILIGCSTAYLSQKRQHATFWKIAQCVLSQKAMDLERELEEKMILSILPQPFAERMMSVDVQLSYMMKCSVGGADVTDAGFTISQLDSVTILFADIVDFTEFSASLSAEELVGILNELFSSFDDLVVRYKCEKISTLGDCYFCVSGCPEPISSHANNCVDLGLAIVEALEEFRRRTGHQLDMRIGIHTGSVLCGVMGTKRFKFDVWSKDVTIANQIEACGTPGKVVISSATKHFLSSAYVVEPAHIHNQDPDLADMRLFYVVGRRHRALSLGTSVKEWRRRLSTIDTVAQPVETEKIKQKGIKIDFSCCFWNQHTLAEPQLPPSTSQSSTSIAEIFTMQSRLMKCTSYAELANPEVQQQSNMDHKIVELMKEQKVDFDTYLDPQLRVLTLQFRNHDWENAYRNYGRNLDDGSSGEMMETELGYRITKQSYMYDTVTLFIVFLLVMLGSLAVLCGGGSFSLWPSWLSIFVVGLLSELVIIVHVWAVYRPGLFPAWFASYAQFSINWYVRSCVALYMIYYPMTIVYASIGQCTSDVIENTQDLAIIQMAFFVTIVVLISSITFMEVSHFVKLIGSVLSALLACVLVMTLHLQVCIDNIKIESNVTTAADALTPSIPTAVSYETDSPEQYLTNYYHRHVAPEAVILLLLILLILAVVNRMSEVSMRLSFIGRIEAAGRRRYTRQQKTQAEWLLFNIIPPRVAYELRRLGHYSQNHNCVGVAFVSISNFNEFHRLTSSIQGEAPYCILNQIITEFDMLLERHRFATIEKIKTIGSMYMAASGLDTEGPDLIHLLDLIDFVQAMFKVMAALNRQFSSEEFQQFGLGNFAFHVKVGFNYGPVMSGVVGSRKMLYDIWGDTVNVASRMNTTGKVGKVHMPESCLEKLQTDTNIRFERHKKVHVKGKGDMDTVFVSHTPSASPVQPTS